MSKEQRISVRLSLEELLAIHQAIKLQKSIHDQIGFVRPPRGGFTSERDLNGALICVKGALEELLKS